MTIAPFRDPKLLRQALELSQGRATVRDVELRVGDEILEEELDRHDYWTVSDWRRKLRWLERAYPHVRSDHAIRFARGCLQEICLDGDRGTLVFRRRCEWFRKLTTDVAFAQRLSGVSRLRVVIPELWTRPYETPVIRLWAEDRRVPVPDRLVETAERLLDRFPVERAVAVTHSIQRRYLLRYYHITGRLTRDEYRYYRSDLPERRVYRA